MSTSMHIQNLYKVYKRVLKILSGNESMTEEWMDGWPNRQNDRQTKSYIAPPIKIPNLHSATCLLHGVISSTYPVV